MTGAGGAPRLAREAAENPNVLVYHTTRELTREVIDGRGPGEVRAVAGVRKATANRYRLRVHRDPAVAWEDLLERLDAAARAATGAPALEPCPPAGDDYRPFALAAPNERKLVVEGVAAAAADPLAAGLFAIDGVAEAIFERGSPEVTVRKGRLFDWMALGPRIIMALGLTR